MFRSETTVLQGLCRSPSCGNTSRELDIEWEVVEGSLNWNAIVPSSNPRVLRLNPNVGFVAGNSYRIQLIARLRQSPHLSNAAFIWLDVGFQDLRVNFL